MIWYPDDEDEPDGDASANATSSLSLHVTDSLTSRSGTWEWRAEYPDDDGDDPHVLLKGCGLKSLDDAKAIAERVLRRWLARQIADLNPDWVEPVASLVIPSPWIPVEERLPEDFDAVVILARECDGYVYRGLASYDAQYGKWIVNGGSGHGLTVSHWLELPPLPVAEVEE